MINCNLNTLFNKMGLKTEYCIDSYDREKRAKTAGERFVQVGKMLSESNVIGLRLSNLSSPNRQLMAFSSEGLKVSEEDYQWIFDKCAETDLRLYSDKENRDREIKASYSLHCPSKSVEKSDDFDGYEFFDYDIPDKPKVTYREMFAELLKLDAVIRITTGNERSGCNSITIGLPYEMPLRIQAMISFAIPGVKITEISKSEYEDKPNVTYDCVQGCVEGLLDALMQQHPIQDNKTKAEINGYSIEDMKIEDMDFSVRAFNCLKRAGIATVGNLSEMTEEDLMKVRNLGRKSFWEVKQKLHDNGILLKNESASNEISRYEQAEIGNSCSEESNPRSATELLDELIGLKQVKEQVRKITAFARMQQHMTKCKKQSIPVVLNMEFVGNPGTAKTTVARIMAKLLHEIGLLESGKIVEVGRSDLIAEYVGQTATKVKKVFSKARGKLLFIDEAYSLTDCRKGDYGDEAINTIVQEMENNREDTVVIFAGYPNEMNEFFSKNPGLRSRVPFKIEFPDYSVNELVQIVDLEAQRRGFSIDSDARKKIADICEKSVGKTENGNGRFCRNLVDDAILCYAARVYGGFDQTSDPINDFSLKGCDFTISKELIISEKKSSIGFSV